MLVALVHMVMMAVAVLIAVAMWVGAMVLIAPVVTVYWQPLLLGIGILLLLGMVTFVLRWLVQGVQTLWSKTASIPQDRVHKVASASRGFDGKAASSPPPPSPQQVQSERWRQAWVQVEAMVPASPQPVETKLHAGREEKPQSWLDPLSWLWEQKESTQTKATQTEAPIPLHDRVIAARERCERLLRHLEVHGGADSEAQDFAERMQTRLPEMVQKHLQACQAATEAERQQTLVTLVDSLGNLAAAAESHRQRIRGPIDKELETYRRYTEQLNAEDWG